MATSEDIFEDGLPKPFSFNKALFGVASLESKFVCVQNLFVNQDPEFMTTLSPTLKITYGLVIT